MPPALARSDVMTAGRATALSPDVPGVVNARR
jgi:hypothetical protein